MTTPVDETRKTVADAIRKAADIADDASEYGADLAESVVSATTAVGKGMVRIPAGLLRKIADMADGG